MMKVLAVLSATLCLSSPAFAAKGCAEDPVSAGHAKFEEQLKKQAYELVLVAEARVIPNTEKKDGEAEFESRGVLYSLGDIRPFVPKGPNQPVVVKVTKKRGSMAMEKGKLYSLYLKKVGEGWEIGPCSHTHEAKGFMVTDVQAEQAAVLKAYNITQDKVMSPANPADKKRAEAPLLKPVAPGAPPINPGNLKNPVMPAAPGTPDNLKAPSVAAPPPPPEPAKESKPTAAPAPAAAPAKGAGATKK